MYNSFKRMIWNVLNYPIKIIEHYKNIKLEKFLAKHEANLVKVEEIKNIVSVIRKARNDLDNNVITEDEFYTRLAKLDTDYKTAVENIVAAGITISKNDGSKLYDESGKLKTKLCTECSMPKSIVDFPKDKFRCGVEEVDDMFSELCRTCRNKMEDSLVKFLTKSFAEDDRKRLAEIEKYKSAYALVSWNKGSALYDESGELIKSYDYVEHPNSTEIVLQANCKLVYDAGEWPVPDDFEAHLYLKDYKTGLL